MLGNFSFGQYFKEGAIDFAAEFVLEQLGLDPDRFWASVFAGDPELGLGEDEVAVALGADRASRASGSSAPEVGELLAGRRPGPCGPDSELHYDRGEEHGCGEPTASRAARVATASSSSGTSSSWSSSSTRTGS